MELIDSWPGSRKRWERACEHLGGGVSTGLRASMQPHPLYFERGAGSRLWDVDGHSYLDYVLGWGPVILGHAHPRLVSAVGEQMGLGQTFGSGHHWEYEVAETVCERVPGAERVLWSNTGSEATQVALRLARAATGRQRFVKFAAHYHGWSDAMLLGYRPGPDGRMDGPGTKGQSRRALAEAVVLPWNDLAAVDAALAAGDVAAVFVEPVLCNSGVVEPAPGFLHGLRERCDRSGTVLVLDEVITGFRVARGGGSQRYGVRGDLVVLAKAIAGGLPLAAVAGRADLVDQTTDGVVHAGTYNGNPVVLAAAAATLAELDDPAVFDRFEVLGRRLADGFRAAFAAVDLPARVNQVGPVVQVTPGRGGLDDVSAFLAADWGFYDRLTVELLRRGVFCLPGGRWYLSTVHDESDVEHTVEVMADAVAATLR